MAKTKNKGDTAYRQPIAENEPTSDIIFILDKMELILRAVTEIEKDGRYRAEIAEHNRRNTFLKIDRNSNMLENFLKNFWSQLKDPTRWGILSVRDKELDTPANKKALEDLAAGKRSEAVTEFLEKYEIRPRKNTEKQNVKQQETQMAKQEGKPQAESAQQPVPATGEKPKYRFNESMINWDSLKNYGLSREFLEEKGLLDQMLRGYKTNQTVPISMNFGSAVLRTDARLSFQQSAGGPVVLGIHGIRQQPELDRPYFGHIFSEEDKKNLRETGNMGRIVELKTRDGFEERQEFKIPAELWGVSLSATQRAQLQDGKAVFVEGMTGYDGKQFSQYVKANFNRGRWTTTTKTPIASAMPRSET